MKSSEVIKKNAENADRLDRAIRGSSADKALTVFVWLVVAWLCFLTWRVNELRMDHIDAGSQMDVTADRVGDLEKRVTALERGQ